MAGRLSEEIRRATQAQSRLRPVEPPAPPPGGKERKRTPPFGVVSLLVLAVIGVAGWFLLQKLQRDSRMQDCVMAGRKNCAPVDTDQGEAPSTPPR